MTSRCTVNGVMGRTQFPLAQKETEKFSNYKPAWLAGEQKRYPAPLVVADGAGHLSILVDEQKWALDEFSILSKQLNGIVFGETCFDFVGDLHFAILDSRRIEEVFYIAAIHFDKFKHGFEFSDRGRRVDDRDPFESQFVGVKKAQSLFACTAATVFVNSNAHHGRMLIRFVGGWQAGSYSSVATR